MTTFDIIGGALFLIVAIPAVMVVLWAVGESRY